MLCPMTLRGCAFFCLAFVAGCGRSGLNDQLDELYGADGGDSGDDGTSQDVVSVPPPPDDVYVPPPEDSPYVPPPPFLCGPSTCPGCCLPDGTCTDGVHGAGCGRQGAACVSCNARGVGGTCEPEPSGPGGH